MIECNRSLFVLFGEWQSCHLRRQSCQICSKPTSSQVSHFIQYGDEIERSVREVNALLGELPDDGFGPRYRVPQESNDDAKNSMRSILNIETKNLNPENEMKKIFGSRVIQTEHHGARHRRGAAGGGRNRAASRASHFLVVPKPNWPNATRTGENSYI